MLTRSFQVVLDSPEATCTCRSVCTIFFHLAGWPSKVLGRGRLVLAAKGVFARFLLLIVALHRDWLPRVPLPPCGNVCWFSQAVRQSDEEDYEAETIGYSRFLFSKTKEALIARTRLARRVASLESSATTA